MGRSPEPKQPEDDGRQQEHPRGRELETEEPAASFFLGGPGFRRAASGYGFPGRFGIRRRYGPAALRRLGPVLPDRTLLSSSLLERLSESRAVWETIPGLLGQGDLEEAVEPRGQASDAAGDRHGRFMSDGVHERGEVLAGEGALSAERLVKNYREREQVASPIQRPPSDLLGRHVGGGAQGRSRLGELGGGKARDAEIGDLGGAVGGAQKDVRRLDVAVDDPGLVCPVEGVRQNSRYPEDPPGLESVSHLQELPEALSRNVLHGDEGKAETRILVRVVDGHDARMGEAGGRLGLTEKPLLELTDQVVGEPVGQGIGLNGDVPLQPGVAGKVNDAHGTPADLPLDLVAPDLRHDGKYRFSLHRVNRMAAIAPVRGWGGAPRGGPRGLSSDRQRSTYSALGRRPDLRHEEGRRRNRPIGLFRPAGRTGAASGAGFSPAHPVP